MKAQPPVWRIDATEKPDMMQIECPDCGRRDETEFTYGGEAHILRPETSCDDAAWTQYLYFRDNLKGVHAERWRHTRGCGQWFHALRNTATHQFVAIYRLTEARPALAQGASR
jgi:sarcosine oxidase subunit delta